MKCGCPFTWLILFLIIAGCNPGTRSGDGSQSLDSTELTISKITSEIEADNRNPELYNRRASLYFTEHDFDKALKDINQAISIDDKVPYFYLTLSDIQLFMGQTDNCLASLNHAIALDPLNQEAHLKLAKLYLILRDYEATNRVLGDMIASDAYNPQAYFLRAISLLERGDTARAVSDLMKAVDQDQQYFDAYMQLGELFSIRKDPLAEGYLTNALRIRPDNKEALYLLAMHYQGTEQFELALQTYERMASVYPGFSYAPYNMGYIYLVHLTDFPQAIEAFTEAIQIDSGYTDAYFNRGYAFELNGQLDRACEDYEKTLKLDVNNPRAIAGLNRIDEAGYVRQNPF